MKQNTYKTAGVDISKADEFVDGIKNFLSSSPLSKIAAFGCPFDLSPYLKKYKNPVLISSTDGVGTKLKIAQTMGIHNGVGIDLVGMNVNDVICLGAQPLFFLDYVACGKLKPAILKDVVKGIYKGLSASNCQLIGGETAEMPGMYDEDEYDLAGFCVGIVDKYKMLDASGIKEGDLIIGLESSGLHSNGFSLARKALGDKLVRRYAKKLLEPTRIYVKPVLDALNAVSYSKKVVKAIAHVTGGAFYRKASKVLPQGIGMVIQKESWKVPEIFRIIQDEGNIAESEMYTVFNMGIGMVFIIGRKYFNVISKQLAKSKVKSFLLGEIVKSHIKIEIV
ncbi:MAG: phosphoribosylformylglycinamidine cyclo-ligase [Candidatus Omnitrophica bacterium]|jgi:phosphoribosylformylglycinamidine cyclo-ligase|nr:phosphoribosylformylglycinamidine cyclo-ligase [Candidatus Omnitrophota bacterium]